MNTQRQSDQPFRETTLLTGLPGAAHLTSAPSTASSSVPLVCHGPWGKVGRRSTQGVAAYVSPKP
jgi:hypothetical protein